MDVKKFARIPDGGGWRGRGALATNHASKKDKINKVGSLRALAGRRPHSVGLLRGLPDEQGATCAGLARAADYFAADGIERIEELMTDNAWDYIGPS